MVRKSRLGRSLMARPIGIVGSRFSSTNSPSNSPSDSASGTKSKPIQSVEVKLNEKTNLPVKPEEKKLTTWEKVKHEAQHYWDGTKLLGLEIKISTKLLFKMLSGYELTRRENRQLERTITDLTRLVPFSVFVIVPFAELLLPVALKLFPNLLPSTYESTTDKEKKKEKLRKTRKVVGDMLRKTIQETGLKLPESVTAEQRQDFEEFFNHVKSGISPEPELILSVAKLFKDDVVLDNLSRPQLVAMSKYMNIQPFGTNMILRYLIRHKLLQIKSDDRVIIWEGVSSLTTKELQSACASRSIKTYGGVSTAKLRDDLTLWLDLRLKEKVPATLLVLSSAFTYGDFNKDSIFGALESVLSALPEELYHEAEMEVASEEATNKQRIALIKEQEQLIKDEQKEEKESGHVIPVKDRLNLEDADKEGPSADDIPPEKVEDIKKAKESTTSTPTENVKN